MKQIQETVIADKWNYYNTAEVRWSPREYTRLRSIVLNAGRIEEIRVVNVIVFSREPIDTNIFFFATLVAPQHAVTIRVSRTKAEFEQLKQIEICINGVAEE